MNLTQNHWLAILIADDHGIVRDGIRFLLRRQDGMGVVGLAATGEQAVLAAQRLRPDVIIMDLVLPRLNGIDATKRILASLPQTKIIVLSACCTSEHVYRALRAGALGYVIKDAAGSELVYAVRTVSSGKQYLSPSIGILLSGDCPSDSVVTFFVRQRVDRQSVRYRQPSRCWPSNSRIKPRGYVTQSRSRMQIAAVSISRQDRSYEISPRIFPGNSQFPQGGASAGRRGQSLEVIGYAYEFGAQPTLACLDGSTG